MLRPFFIFFLFTGSLLLSGQSLRDINFYYLYSPSEVYTFKWKVVNKDNKIEIFYHQEPAAQGTSLDAYSIQWEMRKELSDKDGDPIPDAQVVPLSANQKMGKVRLGASSAGQIAVAKIIGPLSNNQKTLTFYHKPIPATPTPVLFQEEFPVIRPFIQTNSPVSIRGFDEGKPLFITFYQTDFPAAGPPFSTAQAKVPATLKPDSIFFADANASITFSRKGLYLVQTDTASAAGLAFRVEGDYPKLNRLESLTGPLIYICTKLEYDKIKAATSDKTQFDKAIIGITGNSDRARTFMRNYFRRVELANVYFTSYKEGWKTDRGMIYIIYGLPEQVYLFGDREVWEYNNVYYKGRFIFTKSSTVFDPENFVLIRDKKFTDDWYQMIDLWRKAQF